MQMTFAPGKVSRALLILWCIACHALAETLQDGETLYIYYHAAIHMCMTNVIRGHAVQD